jgi:hypothetical protein
MFQLTPLGDDVIYDDQDSSYDSLSEDMNVAYNLGVFARDSISSQVSSRDLQLVSQSDALVVFRPRYRGNLSGGVREEISYHDEVTRHVRVDPWRRIILVDSKDDEDVYMTRQLLEAMYSEVETGGWQFDVGEPSSDPSSDLDSISEETRRAVDSVAASQSTADLEAVIQLVLHDLGRRPDWTVRSARSIAPLQRRGTFVEGEEQKERVLGEMMARLTPLAELAEYSGRRVVRIDDRSPSQLAAELVGHLEE